MATFGKSTIGATNDFFGVQRERLCTYSGVPGGKVKKLSLYCRDNAQVAGTKQKVKGLLYEDAAGKPGALLGETAEVELTAPITPGWVDFTFASAVTISPGTYWVGCMSGLVEKVVGYSYDTVAAARQYTNRTYTLGPRANGSEATWTTDTFQMSCYATFDEAPDLTKPVDQETTKGTAVSFQVEATNTTTYEASGLPKELSINAGTGKITGTPNTAEEVTVTLTVKGAGGEATTTFLWKITGAAAAPIITKPAEQINTVSEAIAGLQVVATSTTTYEATNLPVGLSINAGTGKITGTPTTVSAKEVTLTCKGAGGESKKKFKWKIVAAPTVTKPAPQSTIKNTSAELQVAATGTVEYKASGLPKGLTIDAATGLITGVPTTVEAPTVTLTVLNAAAAAAGSTGPLVPYSWGATEHGGAGQGYDGGGYPYAGGVPLVGIETMDSSLTYSLYLINGEVWAVGHNDKGECGVGGGPWVPGEYDRYMTPVKVTGGVHQFQADTFYAQARQPNSRNFRPEGPITPTMGSTTPSDPKRIVQLAVKGSCLARRLDGKVMAWGKADALGGGWHGKVNPEAVNQPDLVHNEEEAGVFMPQAAPNWVLTCWNSEVGFKFGNISPLGDYKPAAGLTVLGNQTGTVKIKPQKVEVPQVKWTEASGGQNFEAQVTSAADSTFGAGKVFTLVGAEATKEAEAIKTDGTHTASHPYIPYGSTILAKVAKDAKGVTSSTSFEMSKAAFITTGPKGTGGSSNLQILAIKTKLKAAEPTPVTMVATGNLTIETEEWKAGVGSELLLYIRQDSTGGRTITLPGVKWGTDGAPSTNSNARQIGPLTSQDGGATWKYTINTAKEAITIIALYSDGAGNVWAGTPRPLGDGGATAPVVDMSATKNDALFLLEDGTVFHTGEVEGQNLVYAQPVEKTQTFTGPTRTGAPTSPNAVEISTGGCSIARMSDGKVITFGTDNKTGQLGNGHHGELGGAEAEVYEGITLTNVAEVQASEEDTLVKTTEGKVYAWGENAQGAAGQGTSDPEGRGAGKSTAKVLTPTQVPAGGGANELPNPTTDPVTRVLASEELLSGQGVKQSAASAALTISHSLYVWGGNEWGGITSAGVGQGGNLGDLTFVNKLKPIKPAGVNIGLIRGIYGSSGNTMTALIENAVAPKPPIEVIPGPAKGQLKVVWRLTDLIRVGVALPAEFQLSASRKARGRGAEEVEREMPPGIGTGLKETPVKSPLIPVGINAYSADGITYEYTFSLSEFASEASVSGWALTGRGVNCFEIDVIEKPHGTPYNTWGTRTVEGEPLP